MSQKLAAGQLSIIHQWTLLNSVISAGVIKSYFSSLRAINSLQIKIISRPRSSSITETLDKFRRCTSFPNKVRSASPGTAHTPFQILSMGTREYDFDVTSFSGTFSCRSKWRQMLFNVRSASSIFRNVSPWISFYLTTHSSFCKFSSRQ